MDPNIPRTVPRKSATFDDYTLSEIRRAATTGGNHSGEDAGLEADGDAGSAAAAQHSRSCGSGSTGLQCTGIRAARAGFRSAGSRAGQRASV